MYAFSTSLGLCLFLYNRSRFDSYPCYGFTSGCPDKFYFSNTIYQCKLQEFSINLIKMVQLYIGPTTTVRIQSLCIILAMYLDLTSQQFQIAKSLLNPTVHVFQNQTIIFI